MLIMTENKAFTVYNSFINTARKFPDAERLALYEAIFNYGFNGCEADFSGFDDSMAFALNVAFEQIQASIASNIERRVNGAKGGAPAGNQNAKGHGAPKGNQNAKKGSKKQTTNIKEDNSIQGNVIELASYEAASAGARSQAAPLSLDPEKRKILEQIDLIQYQLIQYYQHREELRNNPPDGSDPELTKQYEYDIDDTDYFISCWEKKLKQIERRLSEYEAEHGK